MAEGVDKVLAELAAYRRARRAAAVAAAEKFADLILGEAQRIVPLEEGTLAGTADRETTVTPQGVEIVMFFATVYAARQHEELGYRHIAGRQAKYLEAPFKAAVPKFPAVLAAADAAARRSTLGG